MRKPKLIAHLTEIRELLTIPLSYTEIASRYGVSRAAIGWIAKRDHLRRIDLGLPGARPGPRPKFTQHPELKGRRVLKPQIRFGYRFLWDREKKKYIQEHRQVMAGVLGRPLLRQEIVHHINGDRSDNRPENLALMPNHAKHNVYMACKHCVLPSTVRRLQRQIRALEQQLQGLLTFPKESGISLK